MKRGLGCVLLVALGLFPLKAQADEILVSAAAYLTDAMKEIGAAYTRAHPGTQVRFNFAASGVLQQQIAQGAPVDVFASASPKEMDALQKAKQIEVASRADFAANRLVLIAPLRSPLKGWDDLKSPSVRRIALSNPDSVPSGRYAKEVLTARGLWTIVSQKAVLGENVRQTLTYVANGDVEAGVVFTTDALQEKRRVRLVQEAVPGKEHTPIVYPIAVVTGAPNASAARRFVQFVVSQPAQAILKKYGFFPLQTKHRVAKPPRPKDG